MTLILFFAPDIREVAQRRRIDGFRAAGCAVASFSFAKRRGQVPAVPDWPDYCLGEIEQRHLVQRALGMSGALPVIWRHRDLLRAADVIIARNVDMLCLADLARMVTGSEAALVYECLDIHGIFTGEGAVSAALRQVEHELLHHVDNLILSSPGFHEHYFYEIQGYDGPWQLLENKLWFGAHPPPRAPLQARPGGPLVLGWVGSLRCRPSFELLMSAASHLGAAIRLEFHGEVHDHVLPDFHARVAAQPNAVYMGRYAYPDDLGRVYGGLDLVWAQDLWQPGANSDWLLPNRIYEAGWFGCPVIAVAGTQTAQLVSRLELGCILPHPDCGRLVELLMSLGASDCRRIRARVHDLPDDLFCLKARDYRNLAACLVNRGEAPCETRAG